MKARYLLAISFIVFVACNSNRGWNAKDRSSFINSCISEARSMNKEQAKSYCECMQPKVEAKYKTMAEVEKLQRSEFQSAEWIAEVKKCLGMDATTVNPVDETNTETSGGSGWTDSDRASWASQCLQSIEKETFPEQSKKNYCDCVGKKLEQRYSTFAEMNLKGTYNEGVELGKECSSELTKENN